jgi:glycosyltransferase involved in cell wall biosynthesis
MGSGKPIIASDLSVFREVLIPNRDCIFVEQEKKVGWIRAIQQLADNYSLRSEIACNAHEKVMREYTWDARAASILKFFCQQCN